MVRVSYLKCICPRCGNVGSVTYRKSIGFYVNHGSTTSHKIDSDVSLELIQEQDLTFFKYPGGDTYLLPYLLKMIPPHTAYVEVFGGSGKLLLNKPRSKVEIYNDLDNYLVNLFRVVKEKPREFMNYLDLIPYSRTIYYDYLRKLKSGESLSDVERAAMFYYVIGSSVSVSPVLDNPSFSTSKSSNAALRFFNVLREVRLVYNRLKYVVIENLDFRDCIRKYDSETTLFYLDPPHLYSATEKAKYYNVGFSDADYMDLLNILTKIKGKFLLKQSGATQYVKDWAKQNGFRVRELRISKSQNVVKDNKRESWVVQFIANYKI